MGLLDASAALLLLVAVLALVNSRVFRLPSSIGVTLGGLMVSLLLFGAGELGLPFAGEVVRLVGAIHFDELVFQGVLSFLLFAGALGVDTGRLWVLRGPVMSFALVSTALSIGVVGGLVHLLGNAVGLDVPMVYSLVFGALISPTDPVAVLGMLKHARVPERIETLVAGESLFNDGVGVVAFAVLAGLASSHGDPAGAPGLVGVLLLFVQEALGGLLLGVAVGYVGHVALRLTDDFAVEMLLTTALVLSVTAAAIHLHISAPLAAVAAGLLVGLLTDRTPSMLSSREKFESVWHLIDEVLNVVLFALLAIEIVVVRFTPQSAVMGLVAIPVVLLARTLSVLLPVQLLDRRHAFSPYTQRLMVWGGLRGALSVALAFSVPPGPYRDLFLVMTYLVVVFSILVQGLTVGRLAGRAASAV